MTLECHGKACAAIFARLLIGASASAVLVGGLGASPALAGTRTRDTDNPRYGNGTRNRNILAMRSPTSNRGYQHTATSTAGGETGVQNALCRNVRACTITQRLLPRSAGSAPTTGASPDVSGIPLPGFGDGLTPGFGSFMYFGPMGVMMATPAP